MVALSNTCLASVTNAWKPASTFLHMSHADGARLSRFGISSTRQSSLIDMMRESLAESLLLKDVSLNVLVARPLVEGLLFACDAIPFKGRVPSVSVLIFLVSLFPPAVCCNSTLTRVARFLMHCLTELRGDSPHTSCERVSDTTMQRYHLF